MSIWLIILGMLLVTYLPRLLPLTVLREEVLPNWARQGLYYVPIAVLSAIAAIGFLPGEGWLRYTVDARLLAGVAAIGLAWWTRNAILTIAGGMGVLLLLQQFS
jgi:branched-subunit amino acid transport protein